jgi:hypothetical protein
MKLCKCGKELIFIGGSVQGNLHIELYDCYNCGNSYEKRNEGKLILNKFTNIITRSEYLYDLK